MLPGFGRKLSGIIPAGPLSAPPLLLLSFPTPSEAMLGQVPTGPGGSEHVILPSLRISEQATLAAAIPDRRRNTGGSHVAARSGPKNPLHHPRPRLPEAGDTQRWGTMQAGRRQEWGRSQEGGAAARESGQRRGIRDEFQTGHRAGSGTVSEEVCRQITRVTKPRSKNKHMCVYVCEISFLAERKVCEVSMKYDEASSVGIIVSIFPTNLQILEAQSYCPETLNVIQVLAHRMRWASVS